MLENDVKNVDMSSICAMTKTGTKKRLVSKVPGWEQIPLFWLCLYLSNKCTRRCPYCYTLNQNEKISEMSDEMFKDLLEFIPKVYHESDKRIFIIIFLGGEPLLRTDRIREVMNKAYSNGVLAGGSIFTNADLVDTVNWDDLQNVIIWQTNVCDTSLNEVERRMDVIGKRIHMIHSNTIIITADDFNLEGNRMEDFTRLAIDKHYRIRIYRSMYRGADKDYKKRLIKKYHSCLDIIEDAKSKGSDISLNFFLDILIPYPWDDIKDLYTPYFCGHDILTVQSNGDIGACIRNHKHIVGTIYSENPTQLIKCKELRWTYKKDDVSDECKICSVRQVCQSGCPNDKLITYGKIEGKSPFCEVYKEIIPRLMELQFKK